MTAVTIEQICRKADILRGQIDAMRALAHATNRDADAATRPYVDMLIELICSELPRVVCKDGDGTDPPAFGPAPRSGAPGDADKSG